MLSIPTLWTVFVINFLSLGLIWAYVVGTYPRFESARFWTASALMAAVGALVAMLGRQQQSLSILICGGSVIVFAICLSAMGIRRFYDRPVSWRTTALITGFTFAGMLFFVFVRDNVTARVLIYSVGETLPLVLTLNLLFSVKDGRAHPGARLAGIVATVVVAMFAVRVGGQLSGFDFAFTQSGYVLPLFLMLLLFLSMAFNFGFLLMAVDRLRSEVADLALLDDLTGVANRRHLMRRLAEECARSGRSREPFALLMVDLDGFKAVNDNHGHAAGDACLCRFTRMALERLRPGDMLARTGGDEFCIVLPSSTLREGVMIARRMIEMCREEVATASEAFVPITVSIGVAQWSAQVDGFPDRLMAQADRALYVAKKEGRNRYATHEPDGSSPDAMPERAA
jgi:diguanylate cyclase (GGDEF)-like protein